MNDFWLMGPTRTDRPHFVVVGESGPSIAEITDVLTRNEFKGVEDLDNPGSTHLTMDNFVMSLFPSETNTLNAKAVGLLVPDSKTRTRFARAAILDFIVLAIWLVPTMIMLVGQALGAMLALAGFSSLRTFISGLLPGLYPIFFVSLFFMLALFIYITAWFSLRNKSIIDAAQSRVIDLLRQRQPSADINLFTVSVGWLDMKVGDKIPEEIRELLEAGLLSQGVMTALDDPAYAISVPA